jgi:hypothetical protein
MTRLEFEIVRLCRISRFLNALWSKLHGQQLAAGKGQARALRMCVRQHPLLKQPQSVKCHYLRPVPLQLDRACLIAAPTLDHEPALTRIRYYHYHTAKVMATTPSRPCPMDTTTGTHQRTAPSSCPPTNKW